MSTHNYSRSAPGTPSQKLSALIQAASSDRSSSPTQMTRLLPQGSQVCGPNAPQGVAQISFDPASGEKTGTNRIIFDTQVVFASNVQLKVDSGVQLVDGTGAFGLFQTDGCHNWTLTTGNTNRNGGYWSVDTSYQPANLKSCLTHVHDSSNWLIECVESVQAWQSSSSACCVLPMHTTAGLTPGPTNSPRNFVYRHHRNTGSAAGWGPNQIASAYNGWIDDIATVGGTTLRLETDGNAAGVHNLHAEHLYNENGNYVSTCTPHAANSEHVAILDVRGVSNWGGVFVGGQSQGGMFDQLTITGGCIVAGTSAQNPATNTIDVSQTAVLDNHTAGTVTVTGVGRSGVFAAGSPGGDTTVACDVTIARGIALAPGTQTGPPAP